MQEATRVHVTGEAKKVIADCAKEDGLMQLPSWIFSGND